MPESLGRLPSPASSSGKHAPIRPDKSLRRSRKARGRRHCPICGNVPGERCQVCGAPGPPPAVQATGERRQPCLRRPLTAYLDPPWNPLRIRPGISAQPRGLVRSLICAALPGELTGYRRAPRGRDGNAGSIVEFTAENHRCESRMPERLAVPGYGALTGRRSHCTRGVGVPGPAKGRRRPGQLSPPSAGASHASWSAGAGRRIRPPRLPVCMSRLSRAARTSWYCGRWVPRLSFPGRRCWRRAR